MTVAWIRYNQTTDEIEEHADIEEGLDYKEAILEALLPETDDCDDTGCWNETYFAYKRENGDDIFIQPAEEED